MHKIIIIILVTLFLINDSFAKNRYALVIGNSNYAFDQLMNPSNDAKDIASALEKYNFDVNLLSNATLSQLDSSLDTFTSNLQLSQGIGLIYFAGHGVQLDNENYLLPVDVSTSSIEALQDTSLSLNDIVKQLDEAQNKLNLVILDACRNNPFESTTAPGISRGLKTDGAIDDGLAPVAISVSSGTIFWYATRPGDVALDGSGRNSPFTKNLLAALQDESIPARSVISKVAIHMHEQKINQQPWQEGIWLEDFYFDSTNKSKSISLQVAHTATEKRVINDALREYIRSCKTSGRKCEDLETAEKLIKQPTEVAGYDSWLGMWQCTWANSDNSDKGTSVIEFTKFENNFLHGNVKDSDCIGSSKIKIDTRLKQMRFTLLQVQGLAYRQCTTKQIAIKQVTTSQEQTAFSASYVSYQANGFPLGPGEQTCIKIF